MNCPYCGTEIQQTDRFCPNCGAPLAETAAASPEAPAAPPVAQEPQIFQSAGLESPTAESTVYAAPAAPIESLKEFMESSVCPQDVKKTLKTSWIMMFICAGISALGQIAGGSFPFDGILMAIIAVWLMRSKSFAAGMTACIVGFVELIVTSIVMHRFAGYLPALAGTYALTATLKAKKLFESYQAKGGM